MVLHHIMHRITGNAQFYTRVHSVETALLRWLGRAHLAHVLVYLGCHPVLDHGEA